MSTIGAAEKLEPLWWGILPYKQYTESYTVFRVVYVHIYNVQSYTTFMIVYVHIYNVGCLRLDITLYCHKRWRARCILHTVGGADNALA